MTKPMYSLSGVKIDIRDADRILLIIAETMARPLMSNAEGDKLFGPMNAALICDELQKYGYEIRLREGDRTDSASE